LRQRKQLIIVHVRKLADLVLGMLDQFQLVVFPIAKLLASSDICTSYSLNQIVLRDMSKIGISLDPVKSFNASPAASSITLKEILQDSHQAGNRGI
jgi:hypothetical protein